LPKPESSRESRGRERQATVESLPETPVHTAFRFGSPTPTPRISRRSMRSPIRVPQTLQLPLRVKRDSVPIVPKTGALPNIQELRNQLQDMKKQQDFYQEALGGGAPPTKLPVYTREGAPDPGNSGSDGKDDQPRRCKAPNGHPQGRGLAGPHPSTLQPAPATSHQKKDPPCNEATEFRMKSDEDYRPSLEQCRDYIFMKRSRFASDKEKVL
jgi:hypothetical protein